ncbi:MAG TPA: type II toxin-antitoxin system RelE/ParE family toxin [Verrucomicrobiae bacterium]|nr:type II toxin-antitoxin system RelE/ParE family toxin [Verrucomicrobiae bacterium]
MSSSLPSRKHLPGWSCTRNVIVYSTKISVASWWERFPYRIFFQVRGDNVIVFRVLHHARDYPEELTRG